MVGNSFDQWQEIIELCKGNALQPPEKREPRPHQVPAISSARKHFVTQKNTRGKLIMPCGTGKSLTAYWIAKELKAKSIVLAVPSIALIKQSLEDWTREYLSEGVRPNWVAICSDDDVGNMREADSTVATVYEAGIPVTTNADDIRSFLTKKSANPKVIFTTYQSSDVVADVINKVGMTIDLLIADEAHKTVGRKEKKFATLLFDENIKFKKRLFMTATERVYKHGSNEIVSMDDPHVYGEVFREMSFRRQLNKREFVTTRF